ncbi:FecCD family ABC transporter permease [Roseateles cavernae]|uniref:FecCD family ABC transporter permease n=1 Tax=Roseateles cavernae TaxID=3153578 RepID=UPI0032E3C612
MRASLGLMGALLVLSLLALLLGPGRVGPAQSWAWLGGAAVDAHAQMVLGQLRAPRLGAALLVGAALGAAGVLLQAVTRNPLAEPGLLGVNAGATLAIAAGFVLQGHLGAQAQLFWALGGALAGSALVLLLARAGDARVSPLRLVLAGLALAASARGFMAFLLLASEQGLDQFRFWVLGSLARVTPEALLLGCAPLLAGLALAGLLARPLDLLSLGDELATTLGGRPALLRWSAVLVVGLLAGGAVALVGPIAFLGFVAPYLARALGALALGAQLRLAMLLGAGLLVAADIVARLVVQPFEAPVSAVIAILGAPLLIWMVRSQGWLALSAPGGGGR